MTAAVKSRDALGQLTTPDVILPIQFFELSGNHRLTSEQRLMLAVLVDAINIVQDWRPMASARKRQSFSEARDWIFTRNAPCPLSFDGVCDALGINPDALRQNLGALMSAAQAGTRTAPTRLRLKEADRMQRLTVNRVRRRDHRGRVRRVLRGGS